MARATLSLLLRCISRRWVGLLMLGLMACGQEPTKLRVVSHRQIFQIAVPTWTDSLPLNADAPFTWGNERKNFYLAIRYDSLAQLRDRYPNHGLEDYYTLHLQRLTESMQAVQAPAPDSLSLDSLLALDGQIVGHFKQDQLQFRLRVIQGPAQLYQLLLWMPAEQAEAWQTLSDSVLASFALRPPS